MGFTSRPQVEGQRTTVKTLFGQSFEEEVIEGKDLWVKFTSSPSLPYDSRLTQISTTSLQRRTRNRPRWFVKTQDSRWREGILNDKTRDRISQYHISVLLLPSNALFRSYCISQQVYIQVHLLTLYVINYQTSLTDTEKKGEFSTLKTITKFQKCFIS